MGKRSLVGKLCRRVNMGMHMALSINYKALLVRRCPLSKRCERDYLLHSLTPLPHVICGTWDQESSDCKHECVFIGNVLPNSCPILPPPNRQIPMLAIHTMMYYYCCIYGRHQGSGLQTGRNGGQGFRSSGYHTHSWWFPFPVPVCRIQCE